MTSPMIIGLTGGIGSGKSAVEQRLLTSGIPVIDADKVARQVVEPGQEALALIASHFGTEILNPDGTLNRAALRQRVFSDNQQRLWLEQLLHPLIRKEIIQQLHNANSQITVLASPLLLETNQRELVEYIVVVDLPETLQLERTMQRDNNSRQQVQAIMQAQMSRDDRLKQADWVIDNSKDLASLDSQVDQLVKTLSTISHKKRHT